MEKKERRNGEAYGKQRLDQEITSLWETSCPSWPMHILTFHAKIGTIKDRNGMGLTEAEDIKKRWQEYTELYKADLNDPDNNDAVVTHLDPDILKCEVK